jgi:lysophospholipid acyltransferase (LPLAT)-like uncharacterized protein
MTAPEHNRQPLPKRNRSGGIVVPHTARWNQRLGAWLVFVLVRAISATLRYRWTDSSGHFDNPSPGPAIYCIWHNRLALSMPAYEAYVRKRKEDSAMAALVSASKDGGFLAAILECFNVQPVRGSTSRRGPQALLELTTWAERGYDLAITPDGPRGPRYVVRDGVTALAQITGLPILPFSWHARWKLQVRSWDRFQIPLPFSICEMSIGQPVCIQRDASDAEREALRKKLEQALKEISKD